MKFKTLLFLLVSLLTVTAFAQTGGGIKGTVISRTTRAKIDNRRAMNGGQKSII